MSEFTDGGRAFPFVQWRSPDGMMAISTSDGMSLRDYFAAKAMSGWLASFGPEDAVKEAALAAFAYKIADAMLAAREASE